MLAERIGCAALLRSTTPDAALDPSSSVTAGAHPSLETVPLRAPALLEVEIGGGASFGPLLPAAGSKRVCALTLPVGLNAVAAMVVSC